MSSWFWLDTWAQMYGVEPLAQVRPEQQAQILGGEACMGSEQVSALSIHERVWPRASAVAERLWSPAAVNDPGEAAQRLGRFRCRLAADGLPVGPIWADYCSADDNSRPANSQPDSNDSPPPLSSGAVAALVILAFFLGLACAGILARCVGQADQGEKDKGKGKAALQPVAAGVSAAALASNIATNDAEQVHVAVALNERSPLLPSGSARPPPASLPTAVAITQGAGGAATPAAATSAAPRERIQSIDVFRGFTVALMIFVDNVGEAFPAIHHTPWDGIRLADFVMPFFDFLVSQGKRALVCVDFCGTSILVEDVTRFPRSFCMCIRIVARFPYS